MSLATARDFASVELEAVVALEELERAAIQDPGILVRLDRVRRHLRAVEDRLVAGPSDLRANAHDLWEARRILLGTVFPDDLSGVKLELLNRLWQWEQFLR